MSLASLKYHTHTHTCRALLCRFLQLTFSKLDTEHIFIEE